MTREEGGGQPPCHLHIILRVSFYKLECLPSGYREGFSLLTPDIVVTAERREETKSQPVGFRAPFRGKLTGSFLETSWGCLGALLGSC